jgi:hypothetical protein
VTIKQGTDNTIVKKLVILQFLRYMFDIPITDDGQAKAKAKAKAKDKYS